MFMENLIQCVHKIEAPQNIPVNTKTSFRFIVAIPTLFPQCILREFDLLVKIIAYAYNGPCNDNCNNDMHRRTCAQYAWQASKPQPEYTIRSN